MNRSCCAIWIAVLAFFCAVANPTAAIGQAPKLTKTPAGAVADYSEAASLQNSREFELAVGRWEKFIKKYPTTTLTPNAQYYCGLCLMQLKQYEKAAIHFHAVVTKWAKVPEFSLVENAFLNLGWCHYQVGIAGKTNEEKAKAYQQSAQAFAGLVKQFPKPKGKYVDQGLYFLAESYYLRSGLLSAQADALAEDPAKKQQADAARLAATQQKKRAIAPYAQLIKDHPKSNLRSKTLYALGVTYEELGQYPDAGATYDTFITEFPTDKLFTEVKMRKAETVMQAGLAIKGDDKAQANTLFAQSAQMFGESAVVEGFVLADHALFQQALCLFNQDKFVDAAKVFVKVATDFKQSVYVGEAVLNAGRFFYQGGAFDDSVPWLQRVVDSDPDNAAEAAHWLCRILLRNNEAAKATALATKVLPKAIGSEYLVYLMMDQADALYEIPERRSESLALYVSIGTDFPTHEQAPNAWYYAAFAAQNLKKYDDGLKHAAKFLATYKEHLFVPDTKFVAAECNLQLKKHADAEAGYRDLTTNHTKHKDLQLWQVRIGLCLYLQEKYKEVIAFFTPLVNTLKVPVELAEGNYLIGASHFATGNHKAAVVSLSTALKADPKFPQLDQTLLFLAQSQFSLGQTEDAITSVKRVISDFPASGLLDQAHYHYGQFAYAKEDYKVAVAEYQTVIDKWAESLFSPYSHYGKGWSQMKTEQYAPAVESFTALITKFSEHKLVADAQFARGMARRQTGDDKGAVEDLTEFLKTDVGQDDKTNARYELGLSHQKLKDYATAATSFATILKEDPKCAIADKVIYELAWALKDGGKGEDSLVKFGQLVAGYPDSPLAAEGHFHLGEDLYGKDEFAKAVDQYVAAKKKAKSDELSEKAVYKLGFSYYQQQLLNEALKEFQEQVRVHPKGNLTPDGLFMVAESLYNLDDFVKAYPAYMAAKTAVAAKEGISDDVKVLILLHGGTSAVESEKPVEAMELLQAIPTTYKGSPLVPPAHFEMGRSFHLQGKYDEATTQLEKAYDLSGAVGDLGLRARARFQIGEILFAQQKHDDAIMEFRLVMNGFGKKPSDEVKKWQAYAGYEAGRCAFVRIKGASNAQAKARLIADAKNYYGYVVKNHPESSPAMAAKKDLDVLSKL